MLTVDYDTLGLAEGDLILDMGCGAGRHVFESYRRGGRVIALDYSYDDLTGVRDLLWAMSEEGETTEGSQSLTAQGDALDLPFADGTFDKIIASEVMEHLGDDRRALSEMVRVLKPGGTIAITVPSWLPEKVCWAISAEYHAPLAPGGHVRVYTERQMRARMADAGLAPFATERTHALHSPYWWLRCLVGPTNDTNPLVSKYHDLLVWDMVEASPLTRVPERLLNPLLGKSMVVYATKVDASVPADEEDRRVVV